MSRAKFILISNLGSMACVIGGILLAMNDKHGWGWFLTIGTLLATGTFWVPRPEE
jgi:hypothetical protein